MPAWDPSRREPSQSLTPEPAPRPAPRPEPAKPAEAPERVGVQAEVVPRRGGSRSTVPEARERLASKADAAARAILDLAGIGDDPELGAKDESVRGQMLRDAADRMGLSMPSVSVVAHVPLDSESALADLERLLGIGGGDG